EPCAHLPPHDVGPLVVEQRQVAIALHPLREAGIDDRLGGGPHDKGFFELLPPTVRYYRGLRRKSLYVLGLLLQEALRDEEREVRILVTRGLEHVVKRTLHAFPDTIAVGTDNHASAHRRVVSKLSAQDYLVVPRAE